MALSLRAFREFVAAHPLGVVSTVGADGTPEAALVSFVATPEGDLLFDTPLDSRKVANLRMNPRVAIVLGGASSGNRAYQVEGLASLPVSDAERLARAADYDHVFPGSRASDPDFTMVGVQVGWLRWYDASDAARPVVMAASGWADCPG